ncbi:MAG: PaaI family thioesterase [Candidatus Omnitrophica bacterium]|nr:PaaI family thioesterase [Candidatus Omnitrophota bacterium]
MGCYGGRDKPIQKQSQQKTMTAKTLHLEDDHFCFVCGKKNNRGLQLEFAVTEDKTIRCGFVPDKNFQGFSGIVHGGVIGLILDEAMVNLLWKLGKSAVTAEFRMRLKKPAYIDEPLVFRARIENEEKKIIYTSAECTDENGLVVATATAACMKV